MSTGNTTLVTKDSIVESLTPLVDKRHLEPGNDVPTHVGLLDESALVSCFWQRYVAQHLCDVLMFVGSLMQALIGCMIT